MDLKANRIISRDVEEFIKRAYSNGKPSVSPGAKSAAGNSTGKGKTTIKSALEAVRFILDLAVDSGQPPRQPSP